MTTPTLEGLLATGLTIVTGANMNALANNSSVLAAAFSNVNGDGQGGGYRFGRLQIHVDSMAVSSGGVLLLWLLCAPDGSTYEQGSSSVTPLRAADLFVLPAVQTAAIDLNMVVPIPICANIKALLLNSATGAAFPSNNNGFVKLFPETDQYPSI